MGGLTRLADIFISYSKASQAQTAQLAQELQAKGFTVWWDTSLVAGESFRDVIMSELAQARAAIVIWDAASVKSEWVCSEASRARVRGILLPVRTEGVRSHDIPPPFDSLHTELLSNRAGIDAALAKLGVTAISLAVAVEPGTSALALPDKPSIAVLSFTNMTGEPSQEFLGDGIAEDIITMLSRSHSLFVIARNSSFTYKGRHVDVKQIGRELGVRYVLEGSVRRGGNRVRVTAQLIEAETSNHLWAERYDRDLTDIFVVQDEITEAVTIAIEPTIEQTERHRAVRKHPESLTAWEAYQRGLWHTSRIGAAEIEEAKRFFRRAIDCDVNFAAAYAALATATQREAQLYQTKSIAEALEEVVPLAQTAISLDPLDAAAHCGMGIALLVSGDHEGALSEARQALAISPNYAIAHQSLGSALVFSGEPREGIGALRNAMRLGPHDPSRHICLLQIAIGYYFLRDYEAAVQAARETIRSYPNHPFTYAWLARALGQLNRLDEAKQALQTAITTAPKMFDMFVRQRAPYYRPEDYEHACEGLRKAGWEG
jgi:adenylate cyclase